MASIAERQNGTREIWIVLPGKKRQVIRLGKAPLATVETIKARVEHLVAAKFSGQPLTPATAEWLKDSSDALRKRLARLGLAAAPIEPPALEKWIDAYLDGDTALAVDSHPMKPRTRTNFRQVRGWLVDYFGAGKSLAAITAHDAQQWRHWLSRQGKRKRKDGTTNKLGKNTVRKHCQRASQIFSAAVDKRLLAENPFGGMRDLAMHVTDDREFEVTAKMARRVLAACPDNQ